MLRLIEENSTHLQCPLCRAALKDTKSERVINRLGHRKSDPPPEVGRRHEYFCGAVMLTNKDYPEGTMEATCCIVVSGTN